MKLNTTRGIGILTFAVSLAAMAVGSPAPARAEEPFLALSSAVNNHGINKARAMERGSDGVIRLVSTPRAEREGRSEAAAKKGSTDMDAASRELNLMSDSAAPSPSH